MISFLVSFKVLLQSTEFDVFIEFICNEHEFIELSEHDVELLRE